MFKINLILARKLKLFNFKVTDLSYTSRTLHHLIYQYLDNPAFPSLYDLTDPSVYG